MKQITQKTFTVSGMDCPDCALKLEKHLAAKPGISQLKINFMSGKLHLEFDESLLSRKDIVTMVEKAGYRLQDDDERRTKLFIHNMDCSNEVRAIENCLKKNPGIHSLSFNLTERSVTIAHSVPLQQIQDQLKKLGFSSHIQREAGEDDADSIFKRYKSYIPTTASGIFILGGAISSYLSVPPYLSPLLFFFAVLTGFSPTAKKGLIEARNLRLGMNFLMTIAVFGALCIGEWAEAAMVVFLFSLANLLESASLAKANRSIKSLLELAPSMALKKVGEKTVEVLVEEVDKGEVIVIKPGDRIPLDGQVIAGNSSVNQAPITGESMPVSKEIGDSVFAGSLNENGYLEMRVTRKAGDSTLARIVQLVEEAQAQKAPSQSFVEKFAAVYTPVVVSAAVLIALIPPLAFAQEFSPWFYRALVLLVISCPCALVISTPVTIVSALTNAARNGVLIKGGNYLELFHKVTAMAFDKTGTLTVGKPVVQQVFPLNGISEGELLTIAASLEQQSEHPLAKAILEYATKRGLTVHPVEGFHAITGKGVTAVIQNSSYYLGNHRLFEENKWCRDSLHPHLDEIERRGQTAMMLGDTTQILGIIAVADAMREEAADVVSTLRDVDVRKQIMLTGDNEKTARAMADKLGVDEYLAELLPQDKVQAIKKLTATYPAVAMVGDGINDSPALAAADMGISMGKSATDTALETADIVLMNDDLSKLPYLKVISRKTMAIIKQNIAIALLLKGLFVALAILGWATLWMAVFADMGASLIVIFNGMRMVRS